MDFSEAYQCSGPVAHSPDGQLLAVAVEYRLIIRDVETLSIVQHYSCLDKIHTLEWSANSTYVLCALHDRGAVQVWSATDADWSCKIDESPAGVAAARWAPDGLSLLLVAEFCVRMTVWSLVDRKCTYLPGPKHANKGLAFSPSGEIAAVLERRECKDWLLLLRCSDWALLARVQLSTADAADLAWSPDGSRLAVWDSCLYYKVLILGGDGEEHGSYSLKEGGLGIKSIQWSPGGDVLAVGSYDQVLRVLNNTSWRPLLECQHGSPLDGPRHVVVYREEEEQRPALAPMQVQASAAASPQQRRSAGASARDRQLQQAPRQHKRENSAKYVVCQLPVVITSVQPPPNKANPKIGIGLMDWSPDSRLLASVNDAMPHAVWVWDVAGGALAAVLLHTAPVRGLAWAPAGHMLAAVTGMGRLYLWTPEGASIVHVPLAGFQASRVRWAPDSSSLVLADKEAICCAYVGGSTGPGG